MTSVFLALLLAASAGIGLSARTGVERQATILGNGQKGYEGQPGNQGNGTKGYEGQPGNQGGHNGKH